MLMYRKQFDEALLDLHEASRAPAKQDGNAFTKARRHHR